MSNLEWEPVCTLPGLDNGYTYRLRVAGGYVYITKTRDWATSVFVPDVKKERFE